MNLKLKRIAKKSSYTIGKLYVDGKYFCDTLEDTDRGLISYKPESELRRLKVKGKTAIPTGKYEITLSIVSPKFSKYASYKFCGGKLPRLLNVPIYEGVLIHIGNDADDTEGCILVGRNKVVGKVIKSGETFKALYTELLKAKAKGETIWIEIV